MDKFKHLDKQASTATETTLATTHTGKQIHKTKITKSVQLLMWKLQTMHFIATISQITPQ